MILVDVFVNIYLTYWYNEINVALIILLPFIIVTYISRPYTVGRKRIKEYDSLYHATETDEYLFYNDFFIVKDINSKSEIKVEYINVTSVRTSKNFYFFSLKNSKTKIIIPKTPDDKTNSKEFINFINCKIVNSKRKIK